MDDCAKGIQIYRYKALDSAYRICHPFLRNTCIILAIWIVMCLVYWFLLPSIVNLIFHSLPVIICAAVILKLLFSLDNPTKHQNLTEEEKRNNGANNDLDAKRKGPFLSSRAHSVRRRHVNEKKRAEDVVLEAKEEKDVLPTTSFDDLVSRATLLEEDRKELLEGITKLESEHSGTYSSNASNGKKVHANDENQHTLSLESANTEHMVSHNDYDEWFPKMDGHKGDSDAESYEDEDEVRHNADLGVEWTEDDEKNLMDLGLSEIERNKRLQSLMAKRRARKSLKQQIGKHILIPNLIARSKPLNVPRSPASNPPTPGSAPSILLPTHNPFDIPYDPQEEKPNLTGDSFQQEFMAACQRDMAFCRHESFSFGDSLSRGVKKRQHESNFNRHSDKKGCKEFTVQESSQEGESKFHVEVSDCYKQKGRGPSQGVNALEFRHETHPENEDPQCKHLTSVNKKETPQTPEPEGDESDVSSSLSSSEECSVSFCVNKNEVLESQTRNDVNFMPASPSQFLQKDTDTRKTESQQTSIPSAIGEARGIGYFFGTDQGLGLNPAYSNASDLQVELSEVGSPSLTADGTTSTDGESLMYDGDVEKDITSGSEGKSRVSNLSGLEEIETRSGALEEINEDIAKLRLSRAKKNLADMGVKQHLDNTNSLLSESKLPDLRSEAKNSDHKSYHEVFDAEGMRNLGPSSTSDAKSPHSVSTFELGKQLKDHDNFVEDSHKESDTLSECKDLQDKYELVEDNGSLRSMQQTEGGIEANPVSIFNIPVASNVPPESVAEQIHIHSTPLTPKSILSKVVPVDQISPNMNQNQQIDIQHPVIKDTIKLSPNEFSPLQVQYTETSHVDESKQSQKPSSRCPGQSSNDFTFSELGAGGTLSKSLEDSQDEVEILIEQGDVIKPPEPDDENPSSHNEEVDGVPENSIEGELKTGILGATGGNENQETSKDSEDLRNIIGQTDIVQVLQQKGQPGIILTEYEAIIGPSKPVISNPSVPILEGKETTNPAIDGMMDQESLGHGEGKSKRLPGQEVSVEPLPAEKSTDSRSINDMESISIRSVEDVPNSSNSRETEVLHKVADHENTVDVLKTN